MGRTKFYAETAENGSGYEFRERVTHRKTKKRFGKTQEEQTTISTSSQQADTGETTLGMLLRQVTERVMRNWRSLAYLFHSRTFGLFKSRAFLKLAAVFGLGYMVFGTDTVISRESRAAIMDFPTIGVDFKGDSPEDKKSINWGEKNDAAPVAADGMPQELAEDYIARFSKTAISEMHKYGIPASISLAQGLVESRAGTSSLAKKNNNHFGIKCFSRKCRKGHCTNHTDDTHKDFFRKYETAWESWRAHSQILMSSRYQPLQAYGKDYKKWASGLKAQGYATDRNYDKKLIGMIERFNLQRFDSE